MRFALFVAWRVLRTILLFAALPVLLPLAFAVWMCCVTLETCMADYTRAKRDRERSR